MYICAELQMPTVHYSESGLQPAAKIMVLSFTLQIRVLISGMDGDSAVSLKAVTSVYNSIS